MLGSPYSSVFRCLDKRRPYRVAYNYSHGYLLHTTHFTKKVCLMPHSWSQPALSAAFFAVTLFITLPASAAPPVKERLPLTMSGAGCSDKEAEITRILQAIPGVLSVDFNRVPNHVLVDIAASTVKSADVINRVNEAASSWHCKVEFIEGCISATMPTASADPHQHE